MSLGVKKSGVPSHQRTPTLLLLLAPGETPGPHSEYQRKILSCFQQKKGERNHFEICYGPVFFLRRQSLWKNYFTTV